MFKIYLVYDSTTHHNTTQSGRTSAPSTNTKSTQHCLRHLIPPYFGCLMCAQSRASSSRHAYVYSKKIYIVRFYHTAYMFTTNDAIYAYAPCESSRSLRHKEAGRRQSLSVTSSRDAGNIVMLGQCSQLLVQLFHLFSVRFFDRLFNLDLFLL